MRTMKLSDIKISEAFANTTPSEEKINKCRYNWRMYGKQDRFIVVNNNNVLIDGYVMYLVLIEHKEEYAEVKISTRHKKCWCKNKVDDWKVPNYRNEPTTYIYGKHPNSNCNKEFMWRVPKSWTWFVENVQVGDSILCHTKFGILPVIVTKVEVLDKCPVDFRVKRVAKCMIRREGYKVEP